MLITMFFKSIISYLEGYTLDFSNLVRNSVCFIYYHESIKIKCNFNLSHEFTSTVIEYCTNFHGYMELEIFS